MKNFIKRAGWVFLALLFIVTGLGVGVVAFWQATHQKDSSPSQTTTQTICQFSIVQNVEVLLAPEIFKPAGDVTKLEATDLSQGTGAVVKPGDCIEAKYYGMLAATGKKFDEDFTKPEALKVKIGAGQVIPGWDQGIPGMKEGGVRRLVIPSDLAYGSQANETIPANSDLVFIVKIEKIDK